MTSSTLDTRTTARPTGRACAALGGRVASWTRSVVDSRRALRAYRCQERALAGARGSELADLHALARRA